MDNIDLANHYSAKWTVSGWFVGLAYYNWFASHPYHVVAWAHLAVIVGGLFVAPVAIGASIALLASLITKLVFGNALASPDFFAWGAFISPVLAFFASGAVLRLFG